VSIDLNGFGSFERDVDFGYLDKAVQSPRAFHPRLVLNTASDSMLRALRHELRKSSSFTWSVAFVSPRAIALLKQELIDFVGVGRIITSDYLGFNSPRAFSELLNLTNLGIDVRLHSETAFHPKGYVFQNAEGVTAILGSSNLTEGALARNHEWNLRVSATRDSDLAEQFSNLVDEQLFNSSPLTQAWIEDYSEVYQPPSRDSAQPLPRGLTRNQSPTSFAEDYVVANLMQVEALAAIQTVRSAGKSRALVISATGTGKTILSALDVRAVSPERLLFVAHREQIIDRAMREFQRVLGGPINDYGKLAGSTREGDRRYVFATVQTLSQQHVLEGFDAEAFDYVLIDEVHRAGAASFHRVLDHFLPKFLLGMTATPERTDSYNVFELFDYNVPYEIRLNKALELGMLAPFHYYGVADVTFDDGLTTTDSTTVSQLASSERVGHVLEAIEKYAHAGIGPRGLIFCSRKDEAHALSGELNARMLRGVPLRTVALTGEDSIDDRERAVERLEAGELDYILSVDVFNEGVDIPTLNQVIMLRQTQSSIVFVQQLGRGLRKANGKEYLVVIDFIGNYNNNYLIPIALFGDDSLNKESLRKNLIAAEEVGVLAGLSSVRFDRIAQERVLRSLATVNLDSLPNLKSAIELVRNRIGRLPSLSDFLRFESADPIVLATKLGNYRSLLSKLKLAETELTEEQLRYLSVVSRELLTAKRPHELLLVRHLLVHATASRQEIASLYASAGLDASAAATSSAIRSLTLEFNTASERHSLASATLASETTSGIEISADFAFAYDTSPTFVSEIDDVVETGLSIIGQRYDPGLAFTPGRQYSRKDASRLLNWSSNMYSTIYGYRVDDPTKSCPIFVTLNKSDAVSASTAYEDTLLDAGTMLWYSKSKRLLTSTELRPIIDNTVALHVFAKQSDADAAEFYYLGQATASGAEQTSIQVDGERTLPIVKMLLHFEEAISAQLFDYFHADLTTDA
jgi:superfamily II DNA or RNA helicase/HKD family nuclease